MVALLIWSVLKLDVMNLRNGLMVADLIVKKKALRRGLGNFQIYGKNDFMINVMIPAMIKPEAHLITSSSAFNGANSICKSRLVTSSWSLDASL